MKRLPIIAAAILTLMASDTIAVAQFQSSKLAPGFVVNSSGFQSPKVSSGVVLQGSGLNSSKLTSGVVTQTAGLQSSKLSVGIVVVSVASGGVLIRAPLTHW